jgi:GNAT superfamily N-acetyltransferase
MFRPARVDECELLSDLAFRSKAVWGYPVVELGHLFIEPGLVRRGHGRRLLERAARTAHVLGFRTLRIQGDPNAEPFYQSLGARKVGTQRSASIPGRELPVFELELPD